MAVLAESAMTDIFRIPSTGLSAQKAVVDGARKGLDQTGRLFALAGGALSASLNALQSLQLDPKLISCLHNSLDQHCGGVLEAARSPRFWRRTVGPALDAAAISAAIAAVDQLLIHRDALINGSHEERRTLLLTILQSSSLTAAGAIPVSIVLALALVIAPGLVVVLGPLGLIGSAGLGLRLVCSTLDHPSRQEQALIARLRGELTAALYALQRNSDGTITITVESQPIG